MSRVLLTRQAEEDLFHIAFYIARDNVRAAHTSQGWRQGFALCQARGQDLRFVLKRQNIRLLPPTVLSRLLWQNWVCTPT